jgi:hypothetical protein
VQGSRHGFAEAVESPTLQAVKDMAAFGAGAEKTDLHEFLKMAGASRLGQGQLANQRHGRQFVVGTEQA